MKKKNKKVLSDEEFEQLMNRAKDQCRLMKSMQETVKIEDVLF
jgi:organic hydroperoxide reductase OsmC/OhrA